MRSRSLALLAVIAIVGCSPTASPSPTTSGTATATATTPAGQPSSAAPTPVPVPSPAAMTLKVMEFNIEDGGQQVDFGRIVEAIKKADPDVVALEEAEGHTRELAQKAGLAYADVRTQVLSKYPLIDPPGANGRYIYVEIEPGAVVAVSNVHLPSDPYGPYDVRDGKSAADVIALEDTTRLPAIKERLDVLPAVVQTGIPTFLLGDFNTPSDLDWTAATVGLRPQVTYPLAWPVTAAVEAAGFKDSYRTLHPDPVKDPGLTWWADRPIVDAYPDHKDPQDRIDYIFSAGTATPTDVKIIGEVGGPQVDIGVAPWGSDHRSVMTTFTVTPAFPQAFVSVDQRLIAQGGSLLARFRSVGASGEFIVVRPVGSTDTPITYELLVPPAISDTWKPDVGGLAPGDYEVQLLDGSGAIEVAAPFTVEKPDAKVALTLASPTVKTGAAIEVAWRDAPGSRWDWLGIYKRGEKDLGNDVYYVYTGQTVNGSVTIDDTGSGKWPIPPGVYDVHYLLDDGYTSLAVAPLTVTR